MAIEISEYKNKIVIVDFATGETTEREMTEKELANAAPISTDAANA